MNHRVSYDRVRYVISDEVKDLIYNMLHPNPNQRPSVNEIVSSPWMRNTQWEYTKNAVTYEVIRKRQIPINPTRQQMVISHPRSPQIDPSDESSSSSDSTD